jgi:DNA-binding PadR family transcriptional regulator
LSRELLILGLLRGWDTHGYQLVDFLEKRLAYLVDLKKPTTYALLERLRRDGHVTMTVEREGNRPERRVYQVTPQGEAYFFRLLRENLRAFARPSFPDAIGIYFLQALPPEEAEALLNERLSALSHELAEFEPKVSAHAGLAAQPVIQHYVVHLQAERTWLISLLQTLSETRTQSSLDTEGTR